MQGGALETLVAIRHAKGLRYLHPKQVRSTRRTVYPFPSLISFPLLFRFQCH